MLNNRTLFIATKHQKEKVIAPLLQTELGIKSFTSDAFETDFFGTFSGEKNRDKSAFDTVRQKCIDAHKFSGCDLILASEGSFGAHPSLVFVAADEELLLLKDFKNNLEISCREISLETNFDGKIITTTSELLEFAEKIQFPSHGIILKSSENHPEKMYKDSTNLTELVRNFESLKKQFSSSFAETDMRAMRNPTRMKVIADATKKLIKKVQSLCPICNFPGYDVVETIAGLPCVLCHYPTRSIKKLVYTCQNCQFTEQKKHPNNKEFEDPTYCDNCNP